MPQGDDSSLLGLNLLRVRPSLPVHDGSNEIPFCVLKWRVASERIVAACAQIESILSVAKRNFRDQHGNIKLLDG